MSKKKLPPPKAAKKYKPINTKRTSGVKSKPEAPTPATAPAVKPASNGNGDKLKAAVYSAVKRTPAGMRQIAERLGMASIDSNGKVTVSPNVSAKIRSKLKLLETESKIVAEGYLRGRTYRRVS